MGIDFQISKKSKIELSVAILLDSLSIIFRQLIILVLRKISVLRKMRMKQMALLYLAMRRVLNQKGNSGTTRTASRSIKRRCSTEKRDKSGK